MLVGVDDLASTAVELDLLRSAGADVALAPLASGPVFDNIEMPSGRRQRCLSTADPIRPAALPAGWASTPALTLAPVAGELGDDWAAIAPVDAFVALGWQGLLRTLVAGADVTRRAPTAGPLVTRADLVVASDHDLGPTVRPRDAVALIRRGSTLVITHGERGGSAFSRPAVGRSALRTYRAFRPRVTIDPTGSGDVFLEALVATAIDGARLGVGTSWSERLRFAAAAASLAVEAPGISGVPDLAAVRSRLRDRG